MKSLLYHPLRRIHHSMDHDSEEQKTYSGSTKINQPEFTLAFCRKFPYSATLSKIQGPLLNWKISHQEILAMPSRSENFFGGKKFSTGVSLTWIFSITSQSTNLRKKKSDEVHLVSLTKAFLCTLIWFGWVWHCAKLLPTSAFENLCDTTLETVTGLAAQFAQLHGAEYGYTYKYIYIYNYI